MDFYLYERRQNCSCSSKEHDSFSFQDSPSAQSQQLSFLNLTKKSVVSVFLKFYRYKQRVRKLISHTRHTLTLLYTCKVFTSSLYYQIIFLFLLPFAITTSWWSHVEWVFSESTSSSWWRPRQKEKHQEQTTSSLYSCWLFHLYSTSETRDQQQKSSIN